MKRIRIYKSQYWVYKNGSVYSEKTQKFMAETMLNGYKRYSLRINNKVVTKYKHRLMAEYFIPNPDNLPEVRHLNDDKLDNRLKNLCWGTRLDNAQDAVKNGKIVRGVDVQYVKSKLNKIKAEKIRRLYKAGRSIRSLAKEFGVTSRTTIKKIVTNKTYQP